jgi:hypothetical protein
VSKSNKHRGHGGNYRNQTDRNPSSVSGPQTAAIPQQPPSDHEENNSRPAQRRWTNDPGLFWATVAGVIAVIAYTSVAACQACLTRGQLTVIQGQLDEQKADRRPWVTFSGGDVTASHPLLINVKGANFSFATKIKNSGKSMAKSIQYFQLPKVAPIPGINEGQMQSVAAFKKSVVESKSKSCDPANVSSVAVLGAAILTQGDSTDFDSGPLTVPSANFTLNTVPKDEISLWVYFCIAYLDDANHPHGTDYILFYQSQADGRTSFPPGYGEILGSFVIQRGSVDAY